MLEEIPNPGRARRRTPELLWDGLCDACVRAGLMDSLDITSCRPAAVLAQLISRHPLNRSNSIVDALCTWPKASAGRTSGEIYLLSFSIIYL